MSNLSTPIINKISSNQVSNEITNKPTQPIDTDLTQNNRSHLKNKLLNELDQIQHIPIDRPTFDANYIMMNRTIKFLLNFLISFIFLKFVIGKYPTISINQLILLFCTISSVLLYVLDSAYPSCNI